jgi:hypothetical protein
VSAVERATVSITRDKTSHGTYVREHNTGRREVGKLCPNIQRYAIDVGMSLHGQEEF